MYACNQSVVANGADAAMAVVVWCGIYRDVVVVVMSERANHQGVPYALSLSQTDKGKKSLL